MSRQSKKWRVAKELRECLRGLDGVDSATPRGKPAHIPAECPECGRRLELVDRDEEDPGDIWYDEWECVDCQAGILMDWPEEAFEELAALAEEAEGE